MAWDEEKVPELIDIPVYRDTYISQERVDKLCRYLWKTEADYVGEVAFLESISDLSIPGTRRNLDAKLVDVSGHFREAEEAGDIESLSYIAMVDLIYEIERRIRKAIGMEDFEPFGQQIAPGPEGPIPEGFIFYNIVKNDSKLLHSKKLKEEFNGDIPKTYSKERDPLFKRMFLERPDIAFAMSESIRRYKNQCELSWVVSNIFKEYDNNNLEK